MEETIPVATEVIEAAGTIDYTPAITVMVECLESIELMQGYLMAFLLFFVVVVLCYFCYKFFRIFF